MRASTKTSLFRMSQSEVLASWWSGFRKVLRPSWWLGFRKVTPSIQVATLPESNRSPLVIPTEAQRSGVEWRICALPPRIC